MNKNSDPSVNRLAFIDGLRGLAILGVIYHHLFSAFTPPGYEATTIFGVEVYPYALLSNGWLGVSLFFFLSGFVLYYPYINQNRQMNSRKSVMDFYFRRAKRLLPLYYFSILICAFFMHRTYTDPSFFKHLLMLFTFTNIFTVDQYFPPINWVLWSLGIEVWFSLLFPLVILAIHKLGHHTTLILVIVLSLIVRIIGADEEYALKGNPYLNPVKDSILGCMDAFVIGMFCCYVCVNNKFGFIRASNAILFVILGLGIGFAGCVIWDLIAMKKIATEFSAYVSLVLSLSFMLVVVSLYRLNSMIKWVFSNWPLRVLGMMCFSLYIWHGVLMVAMFSTVRWVFTPTIVIHYYLVLLCIAALSYRYIEFGSVSDTRKLFGFASRSKS